MKNRRACCYAIISLMAAVTLAGCGLASAPPVELPAPVTGQIDASAPSAESGKATITGGAGSVEGGVIVLAANERTSGETALLWRATDLLFPKAYAADFPSICDHEGIACVRSEADGSFVIEIGAVAGDTIILVLIDIYGNDMSPRVTITIPAGEGIAACGSGFAGKLAAVTSASDITYALYEGSASTSNKIAFGGNEFEVPGCYASDIAVYPMGSDPFVGTATDAYLIAVASANDKKLWFGIWDGQYLIGSFTYTLAIEPKRVAFAGDPSKVLVGGTGNSVDINLISVTDGSTIASTSSADYSVPANDIVSLDTVGPFADGGYLGVVVGTLEASAGGNTYAFFFDATTLADLNYLVGGIPFTDDTLGIPLLTLPLVVPNAVFGIRTASSARYVYLVFADRTNESVFPAPIQCYIGGIQTLLNLTSNLASVSNIEFRQPSQFVSNYLPRKLAVYPASDVPIAYALTDDGYLWRIKNYWKGVSQPDVVVDFIDITSLLPDPVLIAMDPTGTSLIGGNAGGMTADLSSYIPVP